MTSTERLHVSEAEPFVPYHHHGETRPKRQRLGPNGKRVEYGTRPFIAWDGEGVTRADGTHAYVLFANSVGDHITGTLDKPLTYKSCFELLLATKRRYPTAVHVIYGGGYDANMMMQEFEEWEVRQVYNNEFGWIRGYRIKFNPGKSLTISRGTINSSERETVTLYDVVSFFQCRFVEACDDYLGHDYPNRDLIVTNKARRSFFTMDDQDEVLAYCRAELRALVMLMDNLRERLDRVGLRLSRWDGPGACAAEFLRMNGVKRHLSRDIPEDVAGAARFAYAGGRFELVKCGHVDDTTYEYDINSAYPRAMLELPSLAKGTWRYHRIDPGPKAFCLYLIDYEQDGVIGPAPLFCRDDNGNIYFPPGVIGWYWTPEYEVAREYAQRVGASFHVIEAWEFIPASNEKPFAFVAEAYDKRQALKAAGDGAHVGLKLALNSLYGKMAQQVGWRQFEDKLRIPPYHQLEWAGFVTSYTRAMVFRAVMEHEDEVIAFETDAIFTRSPMDHLTQGNGLGEWKETKLSSLTYLQSGFYFASDENGEEIVKSRGFDRCRDDTCTHEHCVTRENVLRAMASGVVTMPARLTRFVTMGQALNQSWRLWTRWITSDRVLDLQPLVGKRTHLPCASCTFTRNGDEYTLGVWHYTLCGPGTLKIHSREFPIEWINPDPMMAHVHDTRLQGYEIDYEW